MSGRSDKVKGHLEEIAGIITSNDDLEQQGKADQQAGEIEEKVEQVQAGAQHLVDSAKDKAGQVADTIKGVLPHT